MQLLNIFVILHVLSLKLSSSLFKSTLYGFERKK